MEIPDVTRLSSKGQVVLPQGIRKRLGLIVGAKFVVIGEGDVVILKRLEVPARGQLKRLLKESRAYAQKAGLKRSDIPKVIKHVRTKLQ